MKEGEREALKNENLTQANLCRRKEGEREAFIK
jgi:hypothetical protein